MYGYGSAYLDWSGPMGVGRWGWGDGGGEIGVGKWGWGDGGGPMGQGWEFAHLISEGITRFLSKNEQMSDFLKKMSDSLVRTFLVSDLSDSLTIAHFL